LANCVSQKMDCGASDWSLISDDFGVRSVLSDFEKDSEFIEITKDLLEDDISETYSLISMPPSVFSLQTSIQLEFSCEMKEETLSAEKLLEQKSKQNSFNRLRQRKSRFRYNKRKKPPTSKSKPLLTVLEEDENTKTDEEVSQNGEETFYYQHGVSEEEKFLKQMPKDEEKDDDLSLNYTLQDLQQMCNEVYYQYDNKIELLNDLCQEKCFLTSFGKIDINKISSLKMGLTHRIINEILPKSCARILWLEYRTQQRQLWLQDEELEKKIRENLNATKTNDTHFYIQTDFLSLMTKESEWNLIQKPYLRACSTGIKKRHHDTFGTVHTDDPFPPPWGF